MYVLRFGKVDTEYRQLFVGLVVVYDTPAMEKRA